ncbi:serine hydrolase [Ensifer sp. IC3342]|nr:serine hydrolase [Ensifer sp. BRP08]MCA1450910.1 serine hydrolase [Ensifer sp. IC3342]
MPAQDRFSIEGQVSPDFEVVRKTFIENFSRRHELGGACCVFHRGEKVVDLWGGTRNKSTGEPWQEDTMALLWSATKGLAAMTLALAHSRGWLDYEERICTYWPEFAQQGKERITVRQLLAHQAGLFADGNRLCLCHEPDGPRSPGTREMSRCETRCTLSFRQSDRQRGRSGECGCTRRACSRQRNCSDSRRSRNAHRIATATMIGAKEAAVDVCDVALKISGRNDHYLVQGFENFCIERVFHFSALFQKNGWLVASFSSSLWVIGRAMKHVKHIHMFIAAGCRTL